MTPEHLRYAIVGPLLDVSFVDDARKRFVSESAYLDDRPGAPLRFLAEARMNDRTYVPAPWAEKAAGPGADPIRVQQYVDYAVGRMFRRTILCHDSHTVTAVPDPTVVATLHVTFRGELTTLAKDDPLNKPGVEAFRSREDAVMTSNTPLVIAALHILDRVAPASLTFADLLQRVNDRLSVDEAPGSATAHGRPAALAEAMLRGAEGGIIEFTTHPPTFTTTASQRPVAGRIAREATTMPDFVTNLTHLNTRVSALDRFILARLDGTNDRAQLLAHVTHALEGGVLSIEADPSSLPTLIDETLIRFAATALLEA